MSILDPSLGLLALAMGLLLMGLVGPSSRGLLFVSCVNVLMSCVILSNFALSSARSVFSVTDGSTGVMVVTLYFIFISDVGKRS